MTCRAPARAGGGAAASTSSARACGAALEPSGNRLQFVICALSGDRGGPSERRLRGRVAAVDELLFAEIAECRSDLRLDRRDDVLSMLLLARDEEGEA